MADDWTADDIPSLTGRTILVTGANSGIGYETAAQLARHEARVLLGCRSAARAEDTRAELEASVEGADIAIVPIDLADLSSIRAAAAEVRSTEARLDMLINNAGVMAPPRRETADGFELQFGVNHLGHFALTGWLLPMLLDQDGSRVVTVSSSAHTFGRIEFDDLQATGRYRRMGQYAMTKLANLLFTFELQRRLDAANASTIAVAAHPGISQTELGRDLPRAMQITMPMTRLITQSSTDGALPTLRAATDPAVEGGDYYGPKGFQETRGTPVRAKVASRARNDEAGARLWEVSERLTGVRFVV